jgi:hypothetical protein
MINFLALLCLSVLFSSEYATAYLFPRILSKNIRFSSNLKLFNNDLTHLASTEQTIDGLHSYPIRLSDEEEEEEEEAAPATTEAPEETTSGMSLIKEGVNFSAPMNGSDVRVGIIATKWNADVISGLAKVIPLLSIAQYTLTLTKPSIS